MSQDIIRQHKQAKAKEYAAKYRLRQGIRPRLTQEECKAIKHVWDQIGYFTTQADCAAQCGVSIGFLRKVIREHEQL